MTIELVPIVEGGGAFHSFNTIISRENILQSWKEFLKGKRYKKDVSEFSLKLDFNLRSLHYDLKNKIYSHSTYIAFRISDPKPRDIHKATVRDRVVHHALYKILYPYFDTKFIYDSYSCRVGKGTHKARTRFEQFYNKVSQNKTKQVWVLKCDIKKFFATIDHVILKNILRKHIDDKGILMLLFNIIDSFHTKDTPYKGLPLGNLTSQLLVNIYMNEFDQYVKHILKIQYYIRYADDFAVLSQDKQYLEDILASIAEYLTQRLKLELHPKKVSIATYSSGIDFLGFVHFPYHKTLRTVTKNRMLQNLARNTNPETKASYLGMLKWGNTWKIQKDI